MTVLGECWDDTHKSRSVIKFVCLPTLTRLFLLVADASRRHCCFSPCLCYTPDVADLSGLLLRVMRNPCLFACARDTSVCCVQGSELLSSSSQEDPIVEPDVRNTSESSRDRLCRSAAKWATHCELLNNDTSPRSHRESESITENDYRSAQQAIPDSKCSCGCAVLRTTRTALYPGANCIDTMRSKTGMIQSLGQAHTILGLEPCNRCTFS